MNQRGTHNEEYIHVCDWLATFAHLAGVDPEDPNTVGHRYDGTPFPLPGIDSVNPKAHGQLLHWTTGPACCPKSQLLVDF